MSEENMDATESKTEGLGTETSNLGMNEDWSDSESNSNGPSSPAPGNEDMDSTSDSDREYPFHDAVDSNDVAQFEALLKQRNDRLNKFKEEVMKNSDEGAATSDGQPLYKPSFNDDLSKKDVEGLTPLHVAILKLQTEFVRLCLEADADISVKCEKVSLVHLILSVGSIPNQTNKDFSLLILKEVLRKNASVADQDDLGRTCLHLCAEFGLVECCTEICNYVIGGLGAGIGIETLVAKKDLLGRTALHVACAIGCEEILEMLLNHNADVNSEDSFGRTPLHHAIENGNLACVKLLVEEKDANVAATDAYGVDSLQLARRVGYTDVLQFLQRSEDSDTGHTQTRNTVLDTLLLHHPLCVQHHTCDPEMLNNRNFAEEVPSENVNRLTVLLNQDIGILRSYRLRNRLQWQQAPRANIVDILRVHEYTYVEKLKRFCESIPEGGTGELDGDTTISRKSFEAAMVAAGSVVAAIDRVCGSKTHRNAFCAVRPPGHHAGPRGVVTCENDPHGSYGFCLFSNAAIGAAYARNVYRNGPDKVQRVAIIDFDVHHGNGTEACVRNVKPSRKEIKLDGVFCDISVTAPNYKPWLNENDEDETFFASIHGYGKRVPGFDPDPNKPPMIGNFYPSSGETFSVPNPDKNILNVGQNSKRRVEWKKSWRDVILPDLVRFHPDLIIISAGFDAHMRDDINMGYISVMEYDYSWLTKELVKIANKCCDGRVVSVLEGGYRIQGKVVSPFARSVCEHVAALVETSPYEIYDEAEAKKEAEDEGDFDPIQKNIEESRPIFVGRSQRPKRAAAANKVDYAKLNEEMEAETKKKLEESQISAEAKLSDTADQRDIDTPAAKKPRQE